MPNFTTGPATLPDVGTLSYNGCVFSPLFESSVSGRVVQDDANRTTKFMEYTITVDGYATLPDNASTVEDVTTTMRQLLTAQAGVLIYKGRSCSILVNQPGSKIRDVAWGPIPELLDFQTMGGTRSAKVRWQVKTRITEFVTGGTLGALQFNEETSVSYDEAGFSSLYIRGILEIPMTRETQSSRGLTQTVDNFRDRYLEPVSNGFDLTRFRVTDRNINISNDKRTMNWDFRLEELPYMGLPKLVTVARGSYDFRPSKSGVGLCNWLCTLRVTYTVRKDQPRSIAWLAFLALLRERMAASVNGVIPRPNGTGQNPGAAALGVIAREIILPGSLAVGAAMDAWRLIYGAQNQRVKSSRRAWLIDFSGSEGIYLDSKTVTFSATWRLITTLSAILVASGLWRRVGNDGGKTWAASVKDISGPNSWLVNRLNPNADYIVDLGV